MNKNHPFIPLFITITVCLLIISGCSNSDKQQETFDQFSNLLSNQKYDQLYGLLSTESKRTITKEEFVEKYTNIYSGIEAEDISVSRIEKEHEENVIPFSINMNTIAGEVSSSSYQLPLVKEEKEWKITFNESLIFPTMKPGDKVKVRTIKASRGSILDRNGHQIAKDGEIKTVGINPEVLIKAIEKGK